jgi:hypothetical protein
MVIYNEGDPDDYDTELGQEEDSEESEEETSYPELEKALQEAEGKVKNIERQ